MVLTLHFLFRLISLELNRFFKEVSYEFWVVLPMVSKLIMTEDGFVSLFV